MTAKKQIEWVHIAKGILILMVVFVHIDYDPPAAARFVLGPLYIGWRNYAFFLIAGFFITEERLRQPWTFIRGKARRLYFPLLAFYIPAVLLHNVFIDTGVYDTTTVYGGKTMSYYTAAETARQVALTVLFAGREPILGALWFVYVLFLALAAFAIVSSALHAAVSALSGRHADERTVTRRYELCRAIVLFALCTAACAATKAGYVIPRCNNTLCALWLIYCGYKLRNAARVQFDNPAAAVAGVIIVYQSAVMEWAEGFDVLTLTGTGVGALYVTCFAARKIEGTRAGKALVRCGQASFYIMTLHLAAFKPATLLLALAGVCRPLAAERAPAGDSAPLMLYYFILSTALSLLFMAAVRAVKRRLPQRPQA